MALLRLLALSKFRLQLLIAMPLNFQEVTSMALTLRLAAFEDVLIYTTVGRINAIADALAARNRSN